MPTNKPLRPQPTTKDATPLTRREIEELARQAARDEVQRLLGDDLPVAGPDPLHIAALAPAPFHELAIPIERHPAPTAAGERRFVAHLPAREGEASEVRGTRDMQSGRVVLDNAGGVYASWEAFISAFHGRDRTPESIEWES